MEECFCTYRSDKRKLNVHKHVTGIPVPLLVPTQNRNNCLAVESLTLIIVRNVYLHA